MSNKNIHTDPFRVSVTADDIADGKAGDCFNCAVALALQRATGDVEAHVYEMAWELRFQVWSRHYHPPYDVRRFVYDFDGQPRLDDGRIDLEDKQCEPLKPFAFDLPPLDGAEWEERCYACEELFAPSELDDEGVCPDCLKAEAERCQK